MKADRSRDVPVARDDEVEVDVVGLGDGPDGVAKIGDWVVFVPGVLPGERALVRITSAARKFGRGELLRVLRAAPDRTAPRCRHFLACGGCHRQHQRYEAQLAHKQERVQRAVDHALGARRIEVAATVPASAPYGERHKVAVHLLHDARGRLVCGLHRARSPELCAIDECPASDPLAWDLVQRTVELLGELPHRAWDPWFAPKELLRSLLVRTTTTGEAHLIVVATAPHVPGLERLVDDLLRAGATSISVNHNDGEPARLLGPTTKRIAGRPFVFERVADIDYRLSPTAFFQTAPRVAERVVRHVVEWLAPTGHDDVADLYCGVGLLTLPLARLARSAFGVEANPIAVADARAAAQHNGIANATFRGGDVAGWLAACRRGELPRPHLVALDPPRSGLTADVIEALRALAPRRLAYVSCEPAALQRDLALLAAAGFRTQAVTPFDMFPQTCHVEAVACLARGG